MSKVDLTKTKGLLPTPPRSEMLLTDSVMKTHKPTSRPPAFYSIHDIGYPLHSKIDIMLGHEKYFKEGYEDYFLSDNENELKARFLFLALKDVLMEKVFLPMSNTLKSNNFFPLFEGSFFLKMLLSHTLSTQDIDMKVYPRDLTTGIDIAKVIRIILSFNKVITRDIRPYIVHYFNDALINIRAVANDIYMKILPIADKLVEQLFSLETSFEFSKAPLTDTTGRPIYKGGKMQFNPYKYKLIVKTPGNSIIVLSDIVIYNVDDKDKETLILRKKDVEKLIKENPDAELFKGKTAGTHVINPAKIPGFSVNDPDNLLPELVIGNIGGTKIYMPSLRYYYYNKKLLLEDLPVGKYKNIDSEYLRNKFSKQINAIKSPSTKRYKGGRKQKNKTKRKNIKRKKRKRCSKKRLKKNMICHRGSKTKLRKLRKLTKKLKIQLTKCSKERLKKY